MISDHNDADFEEKVKQVSEAAQFSRLTLLKTWNNVASIPFFN